MSELGARNSDIFRSLKNQCYKFLFFFAFNLSCKITFIFCEIHFHQEESKIFQVILNQLEFCLEKWLTHLSCYRHSMFSLQLHIFWFHSASFWKANNVALLRLKGPTTNKVCFKVLKSAGTHFWEDF